MLLEKYSSLISTAFAINFGVGLLWYYGKMTTAIGETLLEHFQYHAAMMQVRQPAKNWDPDEDLEF
jgi:hypothetical protein